MNRIINYNQLISHGSVEARKTLLEIIDSGLTAADPYYNTKQLLSRVGNSIVFNGKDFMGEGDPNSQTTEYPLSANSRVFLFAIGKGIQQSAKAIEEVLGDRLTKGFVIAKHGDEIIMEKSKVVLAGHPTPDICCMQACNELISILENANFTKDDLVITVIGNGVSSLLTCPAEGISLEDIIKCVEVLQIENGLPTSELNHIRNNIDLLKGGRITKYFLNTRAVHIVAVPPTTNDCNKYKGFKALLNNNFWLHTLPDFTSCRTGIEVLKRRNLYNRIPKSITAFLEKEKINKGITPEEFITSGQRVFAILPECRDATSAAYDKALQLGLNPYILTRKTQCEAKDIGKFVGLIAKNTSDSSNPPFKKPCALIISGELLVTCGGSSGTGGRNQEFVLSASSVIKGYENIAICSVDTDGTDGPGGFICEEAELQKINVVSGGIADGFTSSEIENKNMNIQSCLLSHATSEPLFKSENAVIASQNVSVGDIGCCIIL